MPAKDMESTEQTRKCRECGDSLESTPYEAWLFHICVPCLKEVTA